jgi:hypothetical protein
MGAVVIILIWRRGKKICGAIPHSPYTIRARYVSDHKGKFD